MASSSTVSLLLLISILVSSQKLADAGFNCNSTGATCNGLVGYKSPNATTLSKIQSMFGVQTLSSLLGANNLPLSTPSSYAIAVNQTVKIPFECLCSNGTGMPRKQLPQYKVKPKDGLWYIATKVFSGLVTFPQIQAANNIPNADNITVGQELWIPLPCSCDQLDGQDVVHYGHVVEAGSTLDKIAKEYNTTESTLMALNGLVSPNALLADTPLDVPLKACTSMVGKNSSDYPLLISNGTYAFTAGDCIMCKCDAATNNYTLQCEQSSLSSSVFKTCPSRQCQGNLYLGNTTISSSSSSCPETCSYAGYTNETILTTLAPESTCKDSDKSSAQKGSIKGWSWSYLLVSVHLMVLCLLQ